jgi:hypothetical protein
MIETINQGDPSEAELEAAARSKVASV